MPKMKTTKAAAKRFKTTIRFLFDAIGARSHPPSASGCRSLVLGQELSSTFRNENAYGLVKSMEK